ncbi:3-keto-disaccharide hydrolase [Novosphingobium sp.]|uniref:3-keto-disaccharide hydrolase n=1 Tax=Novosphingobium sp. TaxID=1874826 RepID=UPI003D10B20D
MIPHSPVGRREILRCAGGMATMAAMPRALAAAAAPTAGTAWRALFNGHDLDGWSLFQDGSGERDPHHAVSIHDGMLHFLGPDFTGPDRAAMGHLATLDSWHDYHLRLDFRWGHRRIAPRGLQRRNSGILYHLAPDRDRLFPDGVEFQIEEGDVGDAIMINTRALPGLLLGGTPLWPDYFPGLPRTYETPVNAGGIERQWFRHAGDYERLDGWNTLDLIAFGDQAAHLVNGRIVQTLFGMIGKAGADGVSPKLTSGRIALEFEAAEVFFRNVMIRNLDHAAIDAIRAGAPL